MIDSLGRPYKMLVITVANKTSSRHYTTNGVARQLVQHDKGTTAAWAIS